MSKRIPLPEPGQVVIGQALYTDTDGDCVTLWLPYPWTSDFVLALVSHAGKTSVTPEPLKRARVRRFLRDIGYSTYDATWAVHDDGQWREDWLLHLCGSHASH